MTSRQRLIERQRKICLGCGRDHMTKHECQDFSFDKLENDLMSLLDKEGTP